MRIAFWLFFALTWILGLLPLRVLYAISDFLFLIVYYVAGYRIKVVRNNLANSFPEKSKVELRAIEKKFYHHLCDLTLESAILRHISEKKMKKIVSFSNPEIMENYRKQGKSIICVTGHYSNWEVLSIYQQKSSFQVFGIYKPLTNKYFDNFFIETRERFGVKAVSMEDTVRTLIRYHAQNQPTLSLFVADQSPTESQIHYWTTFLNQETGVFTGVERIAQKMGYPVVFLHIQKIKRGKYNVEAIPVSENSKDTKPFEITEQHVRILERIIRQQPEYWLWSHRRWKHKRPTAT
ncbi:MAG TPA: lysophospholipid acyltransferase family protein [Williamwhitmania sp.]|nr:lysophospholipid acyltransferase family protein [Williamwhitmania sp.]